MFTPHRLFVLGLFVLALFDALNFLDAVGIDPVAWNSASRAQGSDADGDEVATVRGAESSEGSKGAIVGSWELFSLLSALRDYGSAIEETSWLESKALIRSKRHL